MRPSGSVAAVFMLAVLAAACSSPPGPAPTPAPAPTASESAVTPPPPRQPAGRQTAPPPSPPVTVVLNGDLLWHNTLWYGAREDAYRKGQRGEDQFDFAPLLAGIKPVVRGADVAICHEEVPLARRGGPYRNYPRFAAPPHVVAAIKSTGYDLCTTSSNHSLDQGFAGLRRTIDGLEGAGIMTVGTYRNARAARTPTMFTTRQGIRAVVAGTFSTNGLPLPPGKPWAVSMATSGSLLSQARRARAAGADIVLAAIHAGTEYSSAENAEQRRLARDLTASPDVDLVYMHHAHVVQPWAKVNGKWVVYGLGNTVAQHQTAVARGSEGVTARFTFRRNVGGRYTVSTAEYIPTFVTHYQAGRPARLIQIVPALRTAQGAYRTRLLLALQRTTRVVTANNPPGLTRK